MSTVIPIYPFDPDGDAVTNLVHEQQPLESNGVFDNFYLIPRAAPFYAGSVQLVLYPGAIPLIEGKHYNFGHHFKDASHTIGQAIYGSITFYDRDMKGIVDMTYQTLGGAWTLDEATILEILENEVRNPRITSWETIVELPFQFPVVNHKFDIEDFVGMSEVTTELAGIKQALEDKGGGAIDEHIQNKANPHEVTKTQVGLGLVDNFPTASVAEAQAATLNTRFMTPLRTRQAIEAVALSALTAHTGDLNNPHQTTKAHVGLGLVQNYQLASQAEAEAASSNARYMTPLRVREAVDALVGTAFTAHVGNLNNPHQVNKGHVGLGSVQNYGVAAPADATTGTSNVLYMTPLQTRNAIAAFAGNKIDTHAADFNNPHATSKTHVGLGLVQNFGIATEAEARDATLATKYMTPLGVRQAINELVGDAAIGEHVTNFNNPHQVTAAQVGAPSIAEFNNALDLKLDSGDAAANALAVYGMNQPALQAWIYSLPSGNADKLENRSFAQVMSEVLAGKAADSFLLNGKTYADILEDIGDATASSSIQYSIPDLPLVVDGANGEIAPPPSWLMFGTFKIPVGSTICDLSLHLTGGRNDEALIDELQSSCFLNVSATTEFPDGGVLTIGVKHAQVRHLNKVDSPITLAYRPVGNGANAAVELWIRSASTRTQVTVTELSLNRFNVATMSSPELLSDLITVRPAGVLDCEVITDGSAEFAADKAALAAFIARRDNPHVVTKTQVGLGSVPNYAEATQAEALAGTVTNKLMTPKLTKDSIDASNDAILTAVTDTLNELILDFS
jgi:hypothetical protein